MWVRFQDGIGRSGRPKQGECLALVCEVHVEGTGEMYTNLNEIPTAAHPHGPCISSDSECPES